MTAKRLYHFTRTFTEVRKFAIPANSWEEAKLMLEDEYFAEIVSLERLPLKSGYTSKFKRLSSQPIRHCVECNVPMARVHYNEANGQPVQLISHFDDNLCWSCKINGKGDKK